MFDSDDNDDGLSLDGKPASGSIRPQLPSAPSRPAPKNPFGANPSAVPQPEPVKPTIQQRPTVPFGRGVPGGKPQLVNPPTPEPAAPKVVPPFTRPQPKAAPIPTPTPVAPPAAPAPSAYLPPKFDPAPAPTIEPDPYGHAERLTEDELYMREIRERSAERAETARREEEEERAKEVSFRNDLQPTITPQLPKVESEPAPVEEKKAKKKGFFAPPPKTPNGGKKGGSKEPRESKYQGERKKVLYIRLIAGAVGSIIAIAGIQAIFVPDSGPSREQVMAAAQESVNFTGFPTASGEQFAIDFSKAYFNFDSTQETRAVSLERFASPDLVKEIDIQILSSEEYDAVAKAGQTYSDYKVKQKISYGPYVVNSKNLTAENAVFTVKVGLEGGSVLYLDVPVKYIPKSYAMTLAGPPSFSKPTQNKAAALKEEWTTTFETGGDEEIAKKLEGDLKAYLSAWSMSDSTIINRYILESATDNAKKGLQKSVKFHSIILFEVEPFTEAKPQTANARKLEINVLWEDTKTGVRYPQQYRMLIGLNQEGKWAIQDIENFAILN